MSKFHLLNSQVHDRKAFDSGLAAANNFLQRTASKDQLGNVSSTWVLTDPNHPNTIAAFYSLAPKEVSRALHRDLRRQSRESVPALILPWLAVDKRYSGRGFGKKVLIAAMRHALNIMERDDSWGAGLLLDAYDDQALQWYLNMETFDLVDPDTRTLFVSLRSLRQARNEGFL